MKKTKENVMSSESRKNLYAAMARAQAAIEPVVKDATNPHFKSTYATLTAVMEACRKPLADNGLLLIQTPDGIISDAGRSTLRLRTELVHAESGESLEFNLDMPLQRLDPQAVGSAITYARRYALTSLLGMVMEDDDGNKASLPNGNGRGNGNGNGRGEDGDQSFQKVLGDFQLVLSGDFRNDGNRFAQELSNYFGRRVTSSRELSEEEIRRFVYSWKTRQRPAR